MRDSFLTLVWLSFSNSLTVTIPSLHEKSKVLSVGVDERWHPRHQRATFVLVEATSNVNRVQAHNVQLSIVAPRVSQTWHSSTVVLSHNVTCAQIQTGPVPNQSAWTPK